MGRPLRWYDYFTVNIYFTGLMILAQSMTPLIVPLLVQDFVGIEQQGAYYGSLRLWSLMAAVLVQSLMGMLSDHSHLAWGRRRPFMLIGTLANVLILMGVGYTIKLDGMTGFWILFALLILMQVASNTGQGAAQGLIPDIVPETLRGRFSGVKAVLEIPVPVILIALLVSGPIARGSLWTALVIVILIMIATTLVALAAPEIRPSKSTSSINWLPYLRLVLMTAIFTLTILGAGQLVRLIGGLYSAGNALSIGVIAAVGLFAMIAAVILGVWMSVGAGIGKDARQQSSYLWWVINRLAFLLGATNLASFAVFYLQGRLGLERELAAKPASQLILIVGIFILLLGVPSGWLADRIGSKRLVSFSGALATAGTIVILAGGGLPVIYIGAVMVGASAGLFYSASWALGTELVPKSEAGRYLGIANLAGAGAGAIGAYVGGPIADAVTRSLPGSPGLGYVVLFSIYGILFLLSIFAASRIYLPGTVYKPVTAHT